MAIERTNLNMIKGICDKRIANIIPNGEKQSISSKIRKKTHSPLLFNRVFGVVAMAIEEKEVKLSLFADDMILHIENPKEATRKLLELTNEFGKVAGFKTNT